MAKVSVRDIYRQNDILEGLLLQWHSMKRKERKAFIEEIQIFLDAAQQSERSKKNKSTQNQLREMIEFWDDFLTEPKNISIPALDVISKEDKSFASSTEDRKEDILPSIFPLKNWQEIARLISQPLSSNKIANDSPITTPHDSKLKVIFDIIHGNVDATKQIE